MADLHAYGLPQGTVSENLQRGGERFPLLTRESSENPHPVRSDWAQGPVAGRARPPSLDPFPRQAVSEAAGKNKAETTGPRGSTQVNPSACPGRRHPSEESHRCFAERVSQGCQVPGGGPC